MNPAVCCLHMCAFIHVHCVVSVWVRSLIFALAITWWLRLLSMINTNCFLVKVTFFVVCTPVSGSSSFLFLEHPLGDNRQSETCWDQIPPTKQVKSLSLQSNVNPSDFPGSFPPSVYFLSLSRLKPFSPFRRSVGMDNRLRLQSSVEELQTGICTRATAMNHIFVLVCDNKSMH